ncbi:MAG: alpha/beta hydrolase-fold protein [Armatimonadota bacterium]
MDRRHFTLLLIGGALLAAQPLTAQTRMTPTGFLNKTIQINGREHPYVVYVPRNYTPDKAWPVVLFLHGAGERGTDGLAQSQVGIGGAIRMHADRFPGIVVMPQCLPNEWWDRESMKPVALGALDQTLKEYRIDRDRQYLTGLSMGGFGSWALASQHPERWAAVAPICGRGNPAEMGPKLTKLPIWVFHGDKDEAVPVQHSREMVEAIKAAGGTRVKYTEYPGVGHNSWDPAYNDPEFATWLFQQKRGR